jgi:hypothetical protein
VHFCLYQIYIEYISFTHMKHIAILILNHTQLQFLKPIYKIKITSYKISKNDLNIFDFLPLLCLKYRLFKKK